MRSLIGAEVRLTVHKGKFYRSFAKFGKMDPFVVLSPTNETSKTQRARRAKKNGFISEAHSGGHLYPVWDWVFPLFTLDGNHDECYLDVYDHNNIHKNTYMGTAKLDMTTLTRSAEIEDAPFPVVKRRQETGIIWVSFSLKLHSPVIPKRIMSDVREGVADALSRSEILKEQKMIPPQKSTTCTGSSQGTPSITNSTHTRTPRTLSHSALNSPSNASESAGTRSGSCMTDMTELQPVNFSRNLSRTIESARSKDVVESSALPLDKLTLHIDAVMESSKENIDYDNNESVTSARRIRRRDQNREPDTLGLCFAGISKLLNKVCHANSE